MDRFFIYIHVVIGLIRKVLFTNYFKFNALFTVGPTSVAKENFEYHFPNSEKNFNYSVRVSFRSARVSDSSA